MVSTEEVPVVDLAGLTISLADRQLVSDLDLRIRRGERVALLGASGSGKSLTALAILGLLAHSFQVSGSLRVHGRPRPWRRTPGRQAEMAAVFQDSRAALNPLVRLDRQLMPAIQRRRGLDHSGATDVVRRLLTAVGLEDPDRILRSHSSQLSGGQRQRVCLTLAMASAPDLLVADEPTTALDMISQRKVVDAIGQCTREVALLFITHDLALASELCDRTVVLQGGRIVEAGPIADLVAAPRARFTQDLVASAREWSAVGQAVAT